MESLALEEVKLRSNLEFCDIMIFSCFFASRRNCHRILIHLPPQYKQQVATLNKRSTNPTSVSSIARAEIKAFLSQPIHVLTLMLESIARVKEHRSKKDIVEGFEFRVELLERVDKTYPTRDRLSIVRVECLKTVLVRCKLGIARSH